MGAANRRGTEAQRIALAIEKQKADAETFKKLREAIEASESPEDKRKRLATLNKIKSYAYAISEGSYSFDRLRDLFAI